MVVDPKKFPEITKYLGTEEGQKFIDAIVKCYHNVDSDHLPSRKDLDELKKYTPNLGKNKSDSCESNTSAPIECPKTFDDLCKHIMDLHNRKNTDYGNAFHELYKRFGALNYVYPRLYEKLNRVESLLKNKKDAKTSDIALVADEKISDTLLDIATYCIMTVEEMQYD